MAIVAAIPVTAGVPVSERFETGVAPATAAAVNPSRRDGNTASALLVGALMLAVKSAGEVIVSAEGCVLGRSVGESDPVRGAVSDFGAQANGGTAAAGSPGTSAAADGSGGTAVADLWPKVGGGMVGPGSELAMALVRTEAATAFGGPAGVDATGCRLAATAVAADWVGWTKPVEGSPARRLAGASGRAFGLDGPAIGSRAIVAETGAAALAAAPGLAMDGTSAAVNLAMTGPSLLTIASVANAAAGAFGPGTAAGAASETSGRSAVAGEPETVRWIAGALTGPAE